MMTFSLMMSARFQYILFAVAASLLLLGLVHQHAQVFDTMNSWQTQQTGPKSNRPSFKEVADKYGIDKVTDHHYWFMYDKYLEPLRDKRVKMLEIGLGCGMSYGPGKSYDTWLEYFPNLDLYYIEYDAACYDAWKHETDRATVFTGDQADREFLRRFAAETGGDFDVIVDDGGHSMAQQRTSLEELWAILKPGAVYFIEDLQTSFMAYFGGDVTGGKDPSIPTTTKFIYELIDDKMLDGTRHAISKDMRGIDCMREICCFQKMEVGTVS